MNISSKFISAQAEKLMKNNHLAKKAYTEIEESIVFNNTDAYGSFTINTSSKKSNGVVPVK